MLGVRLVRLIEAHSEALSRELAEQILKSDRTSDFRKIPIHDLRLAATEVYRHLEEWLLRKTDSDIERRFRAVAARRAIEGIGLQELVWALTLSRDNLWRFVRQESLADRVVELHAELELYQLLSHFFDRAIYYAILGYMEQQCRPKNDWTKAKEWALSVGLMAP